MSSDEGENLARPGSLAGDSPNASADIPADETEENIQESIDHPPPIDRSTLSRHSESSVALDQHVLSRENYIEMSNSASWTVSSAKPNFGIANVHDASLDTYWQSDGPQPHSINIHFTRLIRLQWLSINLSYSGDESYTPSEILIRSGNGHHELLDVCTLKFNEPQGWQHVDLTKFLAPDIEEGRRGAIKLFSTRLLQIQVIANHQNGKDSHIRSIRMFKPRDTLASAFSAESTLESLADDVEMYDGDLDDMIDMDDIELSRFEGLR